MPAPETVARSGGIGGLLRGLLLLAGLLAIRPLWRRLTGRGPKSARNPRTPRDPRVDSLAVAAGHETRDAPVVPVVLGVVVLLVGLGVTVLVSTWLAGAWIGRPMSLSQPTGLATPVAPPPPPEPRLEEQPGAQLREVRAAEDAILSSTAWVDRQDGIARIPIDRAIDLLAANPPPARSADEAAQYPNVTARPSAANSGRGVSGGAP
jgi:hypothetical protein